ncbi:YsnF/AvaK domain-containing protein [Halalkalibacter alkaliphilus]|uniref:YsnF/AvaK domain-containing protein n=1 Tax=Halalkalibacter alkaliphilus TaxID=2917993 RepID=A0A9X2CWC4_9BACI|nr:YsnF/AvaK domain-containing protein [Halalkalibacter alkaliphilus]MCL7749446.1 YsnF/AvaK domain-containing protein [Halalkalibacter alkaliphilus]
MGFFDLFNEEEETQKEIRKEAREVDRTADTEFAQESAHLDLREEELDIDKYRVETGDVTLHKDIVEEEKAVNVPVSHDQVVIEQRAVDHEPTDEPITEEETIHIPVTAEKIDVDKHTVVTGEVSAHKRSVQETEQVRDVLHKEVAEIEEHGDTDIIREE